MSQPGPWDKPPEKVDLLNPPDRNAPPAHLTTDQLEVSNYYRTGTKWDYIIGWGLAIGASLGFWALVVWALFFREG